MEGNTIDVIENLKQAILLLDKTDEYLDSLENQLSECDSLISDYQHFIERYDLKDVDLEKLFIEMQQIFQHRRIVKNNLTLKSNYHNLVNRLNNTVNREFLIQDMNKVKSKIGTKYNNRILSQENIETLMKKSENEPKKRRGRPKKVDDILCK